MEHEFRGDSAHDPQHVTEARADFEPARFDSGNCFGGEHLHVHSFLPLQFFRELASEQRSLDAGRGQLDQRNPRAMQTLRHMERDGLVARTVHPVVPPKVEYKLTQLGMSLGAAFCGVWVWAAENLKHVEQARLKFDKVSRTDAIKRG
jgi:hypothetical protein